MVASVTEEFLDALASSQLDEADRQLLLDYLHDHPPEERGDPILGAGKLYLTRITAEGFRGVGPRTSVTLEPRSGLTVIVGANGSGKSSFAEAVERVIDGRIARLAGAQPDAALDWRNLHQAQRTKVEVELVGERAPTPFVLGVEWAPGEPADGGTAYRRSGGADEEPWNHDTWDRARSTHPPILPSAALEKIMGSKQSDLFDMFHQLLGLELLDEIDASLLAAGNRAGERISAEASARAAAAVTVEGSGIESLQALVPQLISGKAAPAALIESLATLAHGGDAEVDELTPWAKLAELPEGVVAEALERIAEAQARLAEHDQESAQRASRIADLLAASLEHHVPGSTESCPVCGGSDLDDAWRQRAEDELAGHRALSASLTAARRDMSEALNALSGFLPLERDLRVVARVARSSELVALVRSARDGINRGVAADDLADTFASLAQAIADCRQSAAEELNAIAARRQPVDVAAAAWASAWDEAQGAAGERRQVNRVRKWLKEQRASMREQRLAAINDRAVHTWSMLRQTSGVALWPLQLESSSRRRKLELVCEVDGAPARARSILSRGELHSVALSLFLPRALHPASPFGFLVIDDPVQALDHLKVDGLAQVLEELASERQVVVFTHDERLPEALNRLGIDAGVLRIERASESMVEITATSDPIRRAMDEAQALASDREIDLSTGRRAVAGVCRTALEQGAIRSYRQKALAKHLSIETIEKHISEARSVWDKVGLGIASSIGPEAPNTSGSAAQVRRRFGPKTARLVGALNNGGHQELDDWTPQGLVAATSSALAEMFGIKA